MRLSVLVHAAWPAVLVAQLLPPNPCHTNNGGCQHHMNCLWEQRNNLFLCTFGHDCGALIAPLNGRLVCENPANTHSFTLVLRNGSMEDNDVESSKCSLVCNNGYVGTGNQAVRTCAMAGWDDSSTVTCTERDNCMSSPCGGATHGQCTNVYARHTYTCACHAGWLGPSCGTPDPCSSNPCSVGQICSHLAPPAEALYHCAAGSHMQPPPTTPPPPPHNPCTATHCQNGGSCTDTGEGTYRCQCTSGFQGMDCDTRAAANSLPCTVNPHLCRNGGICTNGVGQAHTCQCGSGYQGPTCDVQATCARSQIDSDSDNVLLSPAQRSYTALQVVHVSCIGGMKLSSQSPATLECLPSGLFSATPQCVPAPAPPPAPPPPSAPQPSGHKFPPPPPVVPSRSSWKSTAQLLAGGAAVVCGGAVAAHLCVRKRTRKRRLSIEEALSIYDDVEK